MMDEDLPMAELVENGDTCLFASLPDEQVFWILEMDHNSTLGFEDKSVWGTA